MVRESWLYGRAESSIERSSRVRAGSGSCPNKGSNKGMSEKKSAEAAFIRLWYQPHSVIQHFHVWEPLSQIDPCRGQRRARRGRRANRCGAIRSGGRKVERRTATDRY